MEVARVHPWGSWPTLLSYAVIGGHLCWPIVVPITCMRGKLWILFLPPLRILPCPGLHAHQLSRVVAGPPFSFYCSNCILGGPGTSPTAGLVGPPTGGSGSVLLPRAIKQSRRPLHPQITRAFCALCVEWCAALFHTGLGRVSCALFFKARLLNTRIMLLLPC